jgi:signal transduction histidine kinase
MTLRQRMILAFGLVALITALLYGTLTYVLFQRQQWSQLEGLLKRELERMEGALANPRLGVPLLDPERGGTVVQLVSADGRVVLPRGGRAALPAVGDPQVVQFDGRYFLAAIRTLAGGVTVRVGLDVDDEVAARGDLARQLVWTGGIMSLLAALLGGLVASGTLAPLAGLAKQARAINPSLPQSVEYRGPPDEVGELASALNATLANIRVRREEERAFLAEVAHELAAPLTLVKGHLDAFERTALVPLDSAAHSSIRAAQEAAQELLLTSQDLLSVARGELERRTNNEVLRLDELLEQLCHAYPGITVHSSGPALVVGDRYQLIQAMRNLVRNAVQATGSTTGVSLELSEHDDLVELAVADRGPGIPPDRLERIFDRYFSGTSGAGVGLTVVNRVVEQHGGKLQVETSRQGSCFTIILPSFAAQLTTAP